MQYWKPNAPDEFVGDMMPLWDGKTFHLEPGDKRVSLHRWPDTQNVRAEALGVENLERGVEVRVCLKGSIIDVCINNQRTLVARAFDYQGTKLGCLRTAARLASSS